MYSVTWCCIWLFKNINLRCFMWSYCSALSKASCLANISPDCLELRHRVHLLKCSTQLMPSVRHLDPYALRPGVEDTEDPIRQHTEGPGDLLLVPISAVRWPSTPSGPRFPQLWNEDGRQGDVLGSFPHWKCWCPGGLGHRRLVRALGNCPTYRWNTGVGLG